MPPNVQAYSKAIAAFIGSIVTLLALVGISAGNFADPATQQALGLVLAMVIPAATVYFAPANKAPTK